MTRHVTHSRRNMSRRRFLRQTARAAATLGAPLFVPSRLLGRPGRPGPNDRIHIGLIGTGIRGKYLIGNLPPEGRIVALCDCYAPRMAFALSNE